MASASSTAGAVKSPFHIAIVGGGIAGLALAIALHKRNVSFTIYEQAAAFGEIGAGVGMHSNAVRAMRLCDVAMLAGFERVATRNAWPSKRAVWFDVLDGTADTPARDLPPLMTLVGHADGHAACHRARFLDELVPLLPPGAARFCKRLQRIEGNDDDAPLTLYFEDGTTARADAVVGCDGIKSRVRALLVGGDDQPGALPTYSHKFVYRGLLPMDEAIDALGEERAVNSVLWMGPDHHALTFPVNHGQTLNLVAFATTAEDWPSQTQLTLPATRDDALRDFAGFGPNVRGLLQRTSPQLERWALFDLADHPLPTFFRGRVCLVRARQAFVWDIDLDATVASARADLRRRLAQGMPAAAEPDPAVPSPPDLDWHLRAGRPHEPAA
ncbi:salicylate 1-monooxygenase SalA [Niveomyces insectorum RCEF 264]|uniref:Salicylate 1-monooxygenase SalA n=1 Tax=Niveomyces insectorum RCEF 264 TaxID=1081102 RepID=A0A167XZK9_9HYPO|nr:salicylate 1-monooxygenase SalA [Niveomyces insectorum RCEF 264]